MSILGVVFSALFVMPALAASSPHQEILKDPPGPLPNFGQVTEFLYRGGQPDRKGFEMLAALSPVGVRTVIDLRNLDLQRPARALWEASVERSLHMRRIAIPMNGSVSPKEEDVEKFLRIMGNPARYPIFVHCQLGRDRTGVMIAIFRIVDDCWTVDRAYQEMEQYGFKAAKHDALKEYLFNYLNTHPRSPACDSRGR